MAIAIAAHAEKQTVDLDPEATRVTFSLGATMHTVQGSAQLEEGRLQLDGEAKTLSGRVVIDSRSLETGNKGRDRKMHAEVLESERFPEIVLVPERFEGTLATDGPSRLTIYGALTIHGQTHGVTLPAEVTLAGERLTARLTLAVPFVEWGMKDPSTFVLRVAKTVEVVIETAGTFYSPVDNPSAE
jgi:polyisoprenoid-binding protein YceI